MELFFWKNLRKAFEVLLKFRFSEGHIFSWWCSKYSVDKELRISESLNHRISLHTTVIICLNISNFFDSCFGRIPLEFTKEKHLRIFFSKFPRNPFKTWVEEVSKASDRFLDDRDGINDVWSNKTSLLLIFNKIVVFRQQMLFFRLISNFYMN